jgi:hypothetical protein
MTLNKPLNILIFFLIVAFILLFLFSGTNYVPYDNKKQKYSAYEPMTTKNKKQENFEPLMESPETIQYGPLRDSEIIDKFSQVTANGKDGVNGCVSSGLSNEGGYICLTPDLIQLMKTRGGNATGGEVIANK